MALIFIQINLWEVKIVNISFLHSLPHGTELRISRKQLVTSVLETYLGLWWISAWDGIPHCITIWLRKTTKHFANFSVLAQLKLYHSTCDKPSMTIVIVLCSLMSLSVYFPAHLLRASFGQGSTCVEVDCGCRQQRAKWRQEKKLGNNLKQDCMSRKHKYLQATMTRVKVDVTAL